MYLNWKRNEKEGHSGQSSMSNKLEAGAALSMYEGKQGVLWGSWIGMGSGGWKAGTRAWTALGVRQQFVPGSMLSCPQRALIAAKLSWERTHLWPFVAGCASSPAATDLDLPLLLTGSYGDHQAQAQRSLYLLNVMDCLGNLMVELGSLALVFMSVIS